MFHPDSFSPSSFHPYSFQGLIEDAVEAIHGGGGYLFLDAEWHKSRVAPKTRKIIKRVAKEVLKEAQERPAIAQKRDWLSVYIVRLYEALQREHIAWNRFYADLLDRQINRQITEQIRLQFVLNGLYEQLRIEEEDEQAILMLLLDL